MFCKKCGTEQKEGQKYCPKCGELFQRCCTEANSEEDPDELKNQNENNNKDLNSILEIVINNISKIKFTTRILICVVAVFLACMIWGIHGLNGTDSPREVFVTLNIIAEYTGTVRSVTGNHGGEYNDLHDRAFSNVITIPDKKMWVFKEFKVATNSGYGMAPEIVYYKNGGNHGRVYDCRNTDNMPIFRSGDQIRLQVSCRREDMNVKVCFIEKEDDLYIENN